MGFGAAIRHSRKRRPTMHDRKEVYAQREIKHLYFALPNAHWNDS
jgi:hypothetical protein